MAHVIGGIGTSHAPTIGVAWDRGQQQEPLWAPLFSGDVPARAWLDEVRPDLFIVVYNDHANQFFFNAYPTLALGCRRGCLPQADEGWGKRDLPDMRGDAASRLAPRAPAWWRTNSIRRSARRWRWITA